jgi:hypothetical protein
MFVPSQQAVSAATILKTAKSDKTFEMKKCVA